MGRCFGDGDEAYERYHDEEWGRPAAHSADERELFERLSLEAFQAGLSWLTVLRKRETFREVFEGFVPSRVAAFDDAKQQELLLNPGIIRNRAKIAATVGNARALLELHGSGDRLADIIAVHAPEPRTTPAASLADLPTQTPGSVALSKELKKRGFRFVGPTTMYALLQALGYTNDHLAGCPLAMPTPSAQQQPN